jgi:hypothetical protein
MKKLLIVLLVLSCAQAFADGGRLRFSRVSGPFLITLFSTPEPLTPGLIDLSVMVQDAKSGDVLSDPIVGISLQRQNGDGSMIYAEATHGNATNKLLQAADIEIPANGRWRMRITVQQGSRTTILDAVIPVEQGSRKTKLIWIFGLLPILALLVFILHQVQKSYLQVRRSGSKLSINA